MKPMEILRRLNDLGTYWFFMGSGIVLISFGYLHVPELSGFLMAFGIGFMLQGFKLRQISKRKREAKE